jgi:hypothetical protein
MIGLAISVWRMVLTAGLGGGAPPGEEYAPTYHYLGF